MTCRLPVTDDETLTAIMDYLGVPAAALAPPNAVVMVKCEGRGELKCENVSRASYSSVREGVLLWAVAHSVFACKAPVKGSFLLHFVQHACLKVKERQSAACRLRGQKLSQFLGL